MFTLCKRGARDDNLLAVHTHCIAYSDFTPAKPWVYVLEALVAGEPRFPNADSELQVMSSLTYATLVTMPENPRMRAHASRLAELVEREELDPSLRSWAVSALLTYHSWTGDVDGARRAAVVGESLLGQRALLPILKVRIILSFMYMAYVRADYDECDAQFARALALTREHGLTMIDPFLRLCECWHRLDRGELTQVAAVLRTTETQLDRRRLMDISLLHHVRGWHALLAGDLVLARQEATLALALGAQGGWTHVKPVNLLGLSQVLIESGEFAEAVDLVRRYREQFTPMHAPLLDFHARLVEAYAAQRQADHGACAASLRAAFELGRQHGFMSAPHWYPRMMSRLAAFALDHDIETAYARTLIRRRGLVPEAPREHWPWRVRVYTLGRFEIQTDDEPLASEGKAQRKPIELLKALIAHGGRNVRFDKLIGILWPEPTQDGGHKALEITIHRLRRLLGSDAAVRIGDRHASLDPSTVWVDAWALERELAPMATATSLAPQEIERMAAGADRMLALYRGHFLAGDGADAWHIPLRTRLSGYFERYALRVGEYWEGTGQWPRAADLYQRVIELDPIAETFYRRQMACLQAQGRRAEAAEVFRRCRHALSVTLGVRPNAETDALFREVLSEAAGSSGA